MNNIIASDDNHTYFLSNNNELKYCKKGDLSISLNHYSNLYIESEYLDNLYIKAISKNNSNVSYLIYKDENTCLLLTKNSKLIIANSKKLEFDYTEYNFNIL